MSPPDIPFLFKRPNPTKALRLLLQPPLWEGITVEPPRVVALEIPTHQSATHTQLTNMPYTASITVICQDYEDLAQALTSTLEELAQPLRDQVMYLRNQDNLIVGQVWVCNHQPQNLDLAPGEEDLQQAPNESGPRPSGQLSSLVDCTTPGSDAPRPARPHVGLKVGDLTRSLQREIKRRYSYV